jgi:predicted nucleotide-binding protein (sugar kinase/HSP70/actin superfamily)
MLLLSLLNIYMRFFEFSNIKPNKPLTAEKARIRALKAHVKSAQNQLKAERKRQQIKQAQQRIYTLQKPTM